MKKLLLLFAAMTAIAFTGCSKDDDSIGGPIEGTHWICETGSYDFTWHIIFPSASDAKVSFVSNILGQEETYLYYYTYAHPNLYFEGRGSAADLQGVITNDGKMAVTNSSTGKLIGVFIKQ